MYPGRGDSLYEKWPAMSSKLLTVGERRMKKKGIVVDFSWSELHKQGAFMYFYAYS